ncbi:hypothetical protein H0A36_11170 [Endozoicomonas sp. SM1973]|uniref:Auto-transporter adhesin head GIN domain-containing protein n=1 Tax=Spartinivicinus marinus TaxID=2994442 RepID=A0A853I1S0_9GAMM|nr:hypothetical protein [Spartinivicinus marinus]MCX4026086.1 hypothetical protein [Spartinivicinus marinus]NYZ66569.1 hypothetical protein [Spartinivicinus marinus]
MKISSKFLIIIFMLISSLASAEQLELLQVKTTKAEICKAAFSTNSIPNDKIQVVSTGVINVRADDGSEFHFIRSIKGAEVHLKGKLESQAGKSDHKLLPMVLEVRRETGVSIRTSTTLLVTDNKLILVSGTCNFIEETNGQTSELWFIKLTK